MEKRYIFYAKSSEGTAFIEVTDKWLAYYECGDIGDARDVMDIIKKLEWWLLGYKLDRIPEHHVITFTHPCGTAACTDKWNSF